MTDWVRDALAEEEGCHICPHSHETYTDCDGDCDHCEVAAEFEKCLEEASK